MINMRDIYYRVDTRIVEQGFWNEDMEGKKSLVERELKRYATSKIMEIDDNKVLSDKSLEEINLMELLEILETMIPKEEHFHTLRHFTHYIINIASTLQNYQILWLGEDTPELENNPVIDFDEDGLWKTLTTIAKEEDDYVKIFNFVYDVFQNKFMITNIQNQKKSEK